MCNNKEDIISENDYPLNCGCGCLGRKESSELEEKVSDKTDQ